MELMKMRKSLQSLLAHLTAVLKCRHQHQPEEEDSSDAAIRRATQNLKVVRALVVRGFLPLLS
jgi:hypothetical protein